MSSNVAIGIPSFMQMKVSILRNAMSFVAGAR